MRGICMVLVPVVALMGMAFVPFWTILHYNFALIHYCSLCGDASDGESVVLVWLDKPKNTAK